MSKENETKGKGKIERSVVMVRPHVLMEYGFDAIRDIKSFYLKDPDLKIVKTLRLTFTRQKAAEFYAEHKGKFFFNNLLDTTTAGESVLFVVEGLNAIEKVRKITGPTDPRKAPENTVRGKYGIEVLPEALDPGSENGAHASDSVASAAREEKIAWGSLKGLE